MSSSGLRDDVGVPPLYRQGGSLSKVGYFKAAHFKINSDDSFRDFLETYWHAIPSGVRVRRVKDGSSHEPCDEIRRAIKFHPYYFVLGFTFPMPRFFQEVLCSMRCAPAQCSPNAIRVMVGFHNLSQFFDLGLTTNEFWYFFDIGRVDGVGQLRTRHRLFDHSSKGDHDWAKETLEVSGEWESDHSPELRVSTVFISDSEFGSTPKVSPDMKKVHVALGIPSEYREWRWLLSPLRREKDGLPPKEEVRRIKAAALARPITVVEPAANDGGRKRHSPPAQEPPAQKKPRVACEGSSAAQEGLDAKRPKTSSAAPGGPPAAPKLVIDLTSKETAGPVPVPPAAPKAASSIADRIAQRRGSSVPKFVLKRPPGAKSDSPSEKFASVKSGTTSSSAKVAPNPVPLAAETKLPSEGGETACANGPGKSAKSNSKEVAGICALLRPDLLEDMDACAKFVDGVKGIIGPGSFVKHTPEHRRAALLTMMQKTAILAAESMVLDREDIKAAQEVAKSMAAEAYSSTEKVKNLESELAALKGSNVSAPTSLQLETARHEIANLKARLDATQVKYESAEKEIERYIPQIQDLERSISESRSAAYAKDEELVAAYNQVIHLKKIVDRLEPQVLELQGALKINESLKNEVEEMQRVRACLLEEMEQLKSEKAGFEASLTQNQSDFYKLGYVDHLFGRPSDFEFFGKDFETFSISPEDLLAFTFESSIGEIVGDGSIPDGAVGSEAPDGTTAGAAVATEGVTMEQSSDGQAAEE